MRAPQAPSNGGRRGRAFNLGLSLQAGEFGLERCQASAELFVLLARLGGHLPHRLELLALDHVQLAQQALALGLYHGFEIAPHALGRAGRIGHELGELVKKPVVGLGHGACPLGWQACAPLRTPPAAIMIVRITMMMEEAGIKPSLVWLGPCISAALSLACDF